LVALIATDLDGTLLGPAATISQRTLDALHLARRAGVVVVAATGRGWQSAVEVLAADTVIEHAVCSNGALLFDRTEEAIVRFDAIAPDAVGRAARAVRGVLDDVGMGWELSDGTFGWDAVFLDHNRAVELRDGHHRVDELPVDDPPAGVLKLLVSARGLGEEQLLDRLQPHMPHDVETTASGISFAEITGRGVHKAKALQDLCDDLGVAADDVVAFGDNRNDVAMLEWAGTSYAMANAHPAAAEAADEVAPHHADDGVAQVIESLFG
jgi:Cof subfamily protein (haloacid dehalogenase superfamily)